MFLVSNWCSFLPQLCQKYESARKSNQHEVIGGKPILKSSSDFWFEIQLTRRLSLRYIHFMMEYSVDFTVTESFIHYIQVVKCQIPRNDAFSCMDCCFFVMQSIVMIDQSSIVNVGIVGQGSTAVLVNRSSR